MDDLRSRLRHRHRSDENEPQRHASKEKPKHRSKETEVISNVPSSEETHSKPMDIENENVDVKHENGKLECVDDKTASEAVNENDHNDLEEGEIDDDDKDGVKKHFITDSNDSTSNRRSSDSECQPRENSTDNLEMKKGVPGELAVEMEVLRVDSDIDIKTETSGELNLSSAPMANVENKHLLPPNGDIDQKDTDAPMENATSFKEKMHESGIEQAIPNVVIDSTGETNPFKGDTKPIQEKSSELLDKVLNSSGNKSVKNISTSSKDYLIVENDNNETTIYITRKKKKKKDKKEKKLNSSDFSFRLAN